MEQESEQWKKLWEDDVFNEMLNAEKKTGDDKQYAYVTSNVSTEVGVAMYIQKTDKEIDLKGIIDAFNKTL